MIFEIPLKQVKDEQLNSLFYFVVILLHLLLPNCDAIITLNTCLCIVSINYLCTFCFLHLFVMPN